MKAQTVLVTGANSGVGLVTARVLAERGAAVVMICRDEARGRAARATVAAAATGPAPMLMIADLSSQRAVRALAAEVGDRHDRIDVLINNAAGLFRRRALTIDGIERTLATNHLAPFLLTNLLLDRLRAAPAARIVNVTSRSHSGSIDLANMQLESGYDFLKSYNLSKLCNLLFTNELARRLRDTNVTVNAASPPPTMTNFGRGEGGLLGLMRGVVRVCALLGIASTPERGARTIIQVATAPELVGVTGKFFYGGREQATKPITHDTVAADRLWSLSEQLCGLAAGEAQSTASGADNEARAAS
jgi:NAD(P)-dependent dehydrogenase (short-subunit alcohol dehydrogenase family)